MLYIDTSGSIEHFLFFSFLFTSLLFLFFISLKAVQVVIRRYFWKLVIVIIFLFLWNSHDYCWRKCGTKKAWGMCSDVFVSKMISYEEKRLLLCLQNYFLMNLFTSKESKKAMSVCFILGLGSLVSWNSMLTIGDYYYKLFPVSHLLIITSELKWLYKVCLQFHDKLVAQQRRRKNKSLYI